MAEYIEREKVYEMLNALGGCDAEPESWADGWDKAIDTSIYEVSQIPAADVRPERDGHWIPVYFTDYDKIMGFAAYHNCSVCNCGVDYVKYDGTRYYEFCPRCGAKMDGKDGTSQ